jgi:hypothetical protein
MPILPLTAFNSLTPRPTADPGVSSIHAVERELAAVGAVGRYSLAPPSDARATVALGWFALCVVALAASGVLAILLVLSRTPVLARLFPVANFFQAALVAHVDLSVLVWFLSFAGMMWSLNSTRRALPLAWVALGLSAIGAAVIAASPFAEGTPIMANYVPVIDSRTFLTGLLLFAAGIGLVVGRGLFASPTVGTALDGAAAMRFGLNGSVVAAAVALLAFAWSWIAAPGYLEGNAYYELLFWGGGHVLQFSYTLLMLVAWLILADAVGARVPMSPRIVTLLFGIGLVAVFATPLVYYGYGVTSVEHHRLQTWLMRFGGGLAIAPVAVAVIVALVRPGGPARRTLPVEAQPIFAALAVSLALFGVGGAIGFAIHGSNVRIPAHYHGSIVSVTIALMGLAYWLLPRLGFASAPPRIAMWQAYLYGGGQLLHIAGLVWSGGYGVQRKVADGAEAARSLGEIAGMGLMGLGGLIAIVGGMLFVVAVIIAIVRRPRVVTVAGM